ncbi:MAG: 5-nucleotidase [Myxococcaceae bacterium]|nr:5-nucleotidase [Myxococcaceae bacterium]
MISRVCLFASVIALCGCPQRQASNPDAAPPPSKDLELTLLITGAENGYLLPNPDDQGISRGGAAHLLGRWIALHGHCPGAVTEGAGACPSAKTLVISTGDNGNGASISSYFRAVPAAEAMAYMGYAASAFGNRELDFGRQQFIANAKKGGYPYLAADLRARDDGAKAMGLQPMKVFTRAGVKVAVIGLTSKKSITTLMAGRSAGFEVLEDEAALIQAVPAAQLAGAHAIVILTDNCLATLAPTVEKHPEWNAAVVAGRACDGTFPEKAGTAVLAYPGRHFNDYVAVKLTFAADKKLAHVSGEAFEVVNDASAPPPEPQLARAIAGWKARRDASLGEEIGALRGKLEQTDPAMSAWLGRAIKEQTASDFGLINRKGMRQGLPAGKLTQSNVYDVIPFENSVVVATLKGVDLIKAFENPEARVIGAEKKAGGWVDAAGQKLDPAQKYKVATLDYLYFGGDGFEIESKDVGPNFTGMGWQTTVIEWTKKLGTTELAPLEDALKKH